MRRKGYEASLLDTFANGAPLCLGTILRLPGVGGELATLVFPRGIFSRDDRIRKRVNFRVTSSKFLNKAARWLPGFCGVSATRRLLCRLTVLASLAVASFSADAHAIPVFSQIIAFGDSYSESGNIARSTDAENWLEYLAADLSIPGGILPSNAGGTNYSLGTATALGTGVVDFGSQLRTYRSQNPVADPDALYVVWLGFNDILFAEDPPDLQDFADAIATRIDEGMREIWQAGGRHFLIPSPWDITTTPFSNIFQTPAVREQEGALHMLFNESLGSVLDTFPEPVHRLDAFGLSRDIFSDPALFGFTEGQSVCPADSPTCEGFIWKDFIHPSSTTHRILADRALAAIPEPSTALLTGLGLAVLGVRRQNFRFGVRPRNSPTS